MSLRQFNFWNSNVLLCTLQSHYDRPATVQLQDISKLGTQLKDSRICNGQDAVLASGDVMVFGTAGVSKYR